MRTVRTVGELRQALQAWRVDGENIALVPTMGALHDGHLSLIRAARAQARRVVVSLFVNPRQFGAGEDLERYPRTEDRDANLLQEAGVDLLYAPGPGAIYPDGFATTVSMEGPALGLEADSRPGFFAGVATVVTKLLLQAGADCAVFGEKDYQQLVVVRRLVADLDIETRIVASPTVREADGLALSSRNAYLDADERARAPRLFAVLHETAARLGAGEAPDPVLEQAAGALAGHFDALHYLAWRDAVTLEPLATPARPGRLLAAVQLGATRLIDNVPVAAGERG
jgi:pantoate--beta-alanine ligase